MAAPIKVAFVVNGGPESSLALRARVFQQWLAGPFAIEVVYRRGGRAASTVRFRAALARLQPDVCYVFDMAAPGVLAGSWWRCATGCRLIIETGDAITALAETMDRGRLGRWLTARLEHHALARADRIVVRGSFHREWLAARGIRADVIPDGVDTEQFRPLAVDDLRRKLDIEGCLTVGVVGSLVWNPRHQTCYGWDLVEMLRLLKDRPVVGVVVGAGTGLTHLQERCRFYGIAERVRFLGQLPYEELPRVINALDVCLSTQTNDLVGQVRTTGKLPLYLACGRYVLASRVGEVARVLPEDMLVEYQDSHDTGYPARLAERVAALLEKPERLQAGQANRAVACARFDYSVLAAQLRETLLDVAGPGP